MCSLETAENGGRKIKNVKINKWFQWVIQYTVFCVWLPLWRAQPSPTPDACGFVALHMKWNKPRHSVTFRRNTSEGRLSTWTLADCRTITFLDFPRYLMELFKNRSSLHGYVMFMFLTTLSKGRYNYENLSSLMTLKGLPSFKWLCALDLRLTSFWLYQITFKNANYMHESDSTI